MASCVYFMCVWVCVLAYTFFLHDKFEIERSKWDGMLFRSVSLRWVVHMLLQHCSNQFVTTVWIIWFISIKKELIFFCYLFFFSSSFFLSVTGGKCWVYKIKTSFWWNIPVYCADLKPQSEELQECTKGWSKLQLRASVVFFPPCLMFP